MSYPVAPPPAVHAVVHGGYQPAFPLTPSLSSPSRAQRIHSQPVKARPKPYHRPAAELQTHHVHHITTSGAGVLSPFSPFTPTSLSSSSSSSQSSAPSIRFNRSHSAHVAFQNGQSASAEYPTQQLLSIPHQRQPQRADSAPALALDASNTLSCSYQPQRLQLPIFAPATEQHASQSSPLVFSAEYLDARIRKSNDALASLQKSVGANAPISYGTESQDPEFVSSLINQLDSDPVYKDIKSYGGAFPYASAYVSTAEQYQAQLATQQLQSGHPKPVSAVKSLSLNIAKVDDSRVHEERKQKYAGDLIDAAIKTIHKIWPETSDSTHDASLGLVTSDGRLRNPIPASSPSKAPRPRRKANQQQMTPDSSPDASKDRKRKRTTSGDEFVKQEMDDDALLQSFKRRCCPDGAGKPSITIPRMPTPPQTKPTPPTTSAATTSHITLKIFVRELLRRSKTSCNTLEVALCYLDGIEETVKKLRDCLKLGITFGTVAMAERGPYDEGMKDEGRIMKLEEWKRQEAMQVDEDGMDVAGDWETAAQDPWTPLSPVSDTAAPDSKNGKGGRPLQPSSQVLATHPLLDARRTFLASLVLATKFIQDKAYSNKAWAKLSGLSGKEVGRCERALGGALQWRLWVGKDIGKSSIRGRSPLAEEGESLCSGETESSVVHGEDDELAKMFMAQVVEVEEKARLKASGGELSATAYSAPEPIAQLQAAADLQQAARAGFGRARTWPALEFTAAAPSAAPSLYVPQVAPTDFEEVTIADIERDVNRHLAAFGHPSFAGADTIDNVNAFPLENCGTLGTSFLDASNISTSPLQLVTDADEEFIDSILHTECPTVSATPATVRMSIDDCTDVASRLATPNLTMVGQFANDTSPPAGFAESWAATTTFPFTFSLEQPMPSVPIVEAQQTLNRSRSMGNLQVPQFRIAHPHLAALRASGSSGFSSSPNTSSTFSSPEVLTPIHSRSSTLVDPLDYGDSWRSLSISCSTQEVQQCVDKLYSTGIDFPYIQTA